MASPLLLVQQVLSSFSNGQLLSGLNINGTANSTAAASAPAPLPKDLPSLLSYLLSLSALREWLKLFVIGSVIETFRRFFFTFYHKFWDSFFITAQFKEDDSSYDWVMFWLSKQPSWAAARQVQISTRSFGLESTSIMIPGEEEDAKSSVKGSRQIAYLPSLLSTYSTWYKGRWMRITRSQDQTGYYGRAEETLTICILARNHSVLNQILREAKKEYMAAQENSISVYVSDVSNNWRHVASRAKRPLNSIVLDPGIKNLLIDDAHDFLESKSWYAARGIPFRRGYLLYGAPGSGKTSIIHSLAGELGLDVYVISLSRAGLDDTALSELISALPEKCIALMEDIDAAFTQTLNRDTAEDAAAAKGNGKPGNSSNASPPPTSRLSLSGLLNALDGVGAQEGRILFATTNKYKSLDPALCRPGRMDIHIEFKLASRYQIKELYRCFYNPDMGNASADEEKAEDGLDSGYASEEKRSVKEADAESDVSSEPSTPSSSPTSLFAPDMELFTQHKHCAGPRLSRSQVEELSAAFAKIFPEREFSMATLQGYLMMYKTRPYQAVLEADAWVKAELEKRVDKKAQSSKTEEATAALVSEHEATADPGKATPKEEAASEKVVSVKQETS